MDTDRIIADLVPGRKYKKEEKNHRSRKRNDRSEKIAYNQDIPFF
jgi:hypothetical protein